MFFIDDTDERIYNGATIIGEWTFYYDAGLDQCYVPCFYYGEDNKGFRVFGKRQREIKPALEIAKNLLIEHLKETNLEFYLWTLK